LFINPREFGKEKMFCVRLAPKEARQKQKQG